MTWTYSQRQGALRQDGKLIGTGYSGHGPGKNNPELQDVHGVGPIPRGRWVIKGPPIEGTSHGHYVLMLEPAEGTKTFGRSGFLMHGDMNDPALRGQASLGCIVMSYGVRVTVWESGDRDLEVIEKDSDLGAANVA